MAVAARLPRETDKDGFPSASQWVAATPLRFSADWRGENADARRETEVRLLWSPETLFIRFHARYRTITVFPDAEPSGRRDHLWDRDVAEVFLQPDPSDPLRYKEFEVSPNGMWIDLDIAHGDTQDLHSGLRRRVAMEPSQQFWVAELALPMKSLTPRFRPHCDLARQFLPRRGSSRAPLLLRLEPHPHASPKLPRPRRLRPAYVQQ